MMAIPSMGAEERKAAAVSDLLSTIVTGMFAFDLFQIDLDM